ncbi:HEAT repeat-containing protein (plasmid) [Methanomethylovorans hollandica DSM 15978]|uniref:HEAT repeat-containing protein n=1 Tax=Methanomethylovorans hollandica (strain DSM 15978 / NBRC 107637 / DMS1) TaxID=867904 RepID=L0KZD5_METHD|nr:HEAT repeat domain-containing protein [Methanomethylovorans hollandica]AGB50782.1 HEAT repeat-containing protein [Methanomethylovorans hollandica DSM 15978]
MVVDQEEIHRLSLSKDVNDRLIAFRLFRDHFESLPDKSSAWIDLYRLTQDKNSIVKNNAPNALGYAFEHVPDKFVAWTDLHHLTRNDDKDVRKNAASTLGYAFKHIPLEFKSAAWNDLHKLTKNKHWMVRMNAALGLGYSFEYIPEEFKSAAWLDLQRLTNDKDLDVRQYAVNALGYAFEYIPDKSIAWSNLQTLTSNDNLYLRSRATSALGHAFKYVPNRSVAWFELHRLVCDDNSYVRSVAASSLGYVFKYIPEELKSEACSDLHKLTYDEELNVRSNAASVIGSAFSYIPEEYKSTMWFDLHRLTNDKYSDAKMYANHSLGKICIYKASKSEIEYESRTLFEEAIRYFETATNERSYSNPAKFCNHFYRSFDVVLFKKNNSKNNIEKYITAAKKEIEGSKSKENLIKAIEQLAEALEMAHHAHESGNDWQETLKHCSDICNRADQLMLENKDNIPAIFDIYEKNKPSFRKNIKELIDEVKEKAEITCKETQGTPAEGVACSINKEIQKWKIESQEDIEKSFYNLIDMMKIMIPDIPKNQLLLSKVNSMENYTKPEDVFEALGMIFPLIKNMSLSEDINYIKSTVDEIKVDVKQVDTKIDNLSINVEQVTKQIMEQPNSQEYLDLIQQRLENIQDKIPEMKDEIKDVLDELYSPLGIERKLKISIPLIPLFMSYEAQVTPSKFVVDRIFEFKQLYSKLII